MILEVNRISEPTQLRNSGRRIPENADDTGGLPVHVDEGIAINAIVPVPFDGEGSIGFLEVDRFGSAVSGDASGEMVGRVDSHASPVSVENRASGPMLTKRASDAAARRWM